MRVLREVHGPGGGALIRSGFKRIAAAQNRRAQRLEIIGRNNIDLSVRLLCFGCRPLFDVEIKTDLTAAEREPPGDSRRFHAGKCRDTCEQFPIKFGSLRWFAVTGVRKRDARGHDVRRVESGRNFLQMQKTFHEQSGTGEQDKGKHNLDHNQGGTRAPASRTFARTARSFIQRRCEIWMGRSPCRKQAGKDSNSKTEESRKREHAWIRAPRWQRTVRRHPQTPRAKCFRPVIV